MKRVVLSIVILLVLLCGVAVAEGATIVASGKCGFGGDAVTWALDSAGVLTISGEGKMRNYGYWDNDNNAPWYAKRTAIKTAVIEAGVTSIGSGAFYACSNLNSIDLPEGMTSIDICAFYGCSSLNSITIPEGVTSINFNTFRECSSLSSIALPESVTSIGYYAFLNCSSLNSITIPESVTSIGSDAFAGCSSLSSVTIPESVTKIESGVFCGCSSLSSVTIPESVTSIDGSAFAGCSSLSSVTIPESVTSIGGSAFQGCKSLNSIDIPAGVTSIGSSAFLGCKSLNSITIPAGVTIIEDYAFNGCKSLSSIDIPAGVTQIEAYAFYDCNNLRSITIPEGVTSIGSNAFHNCSSLSSITIPASVTSIDGSAFANCSDLGKVMFMGKDLPTLGEAVFSTSPTIYCYEGSYVDLWAYENGYTCIYIDEMDFDKPISIDLPESIRLEYRKSYTVKPVTFPENAREGITWESSNPSVVSIENGVLTANAVGEATITASCDGISDQMSVTVYAFVESFDLSETELWVVSKETAQLDVCNIEPVGATASFTWESSNPSVLTVTDGKLAGRVLGDASVTVTSDSGVVRSCLVHVCPSVTAIELEESEYRLVVGDDAQIIANVTMRNQSCVNRLVTFESSDEAVATVDAAGCIRAVAPGTATISVAATSGVSASCTVEVVSCLHNSVTDPAVPATHVTTGLTEGSHCSICGEILVAQQEIPVEKVPVIALPAELETIEVEAFAGDSFVCVVLPEGCRAIGAGAFRGCAQLRFIEIPETVNSIEGSAFENCSDGLIIVAVSGSIAEDFAKAHDITCVLRVQD